MLGGPRLWKQLEGKATERRLARLSVYGVRSSTEKTGGPALRRRLGWAGLLVFSLVCILAPARFRPTMARGRTASESPPAVCGMPCKTRRLCWLLFWGGRTSPWPAGMQHSWAPACVPQHGGRCSRCRGEGRAGQGNGWEGGTSRRGRSSAAPAERRPKSAASQGPWVVSATEACVAESPG